MADDLATLLSQNYGGANAGNPALQEIAPRLKLAQLMSTTGLDTSPTGHPLQALARLAQGAAGQYVQSGAMSDLAKAYAGQAKGAADALEKIAPDHALVRALRSDDPNVRAMALHQAGPALMRLPELTAAREQHASDQRRLQFNADRAADPEHAAAMERAKLGVAEEFGSKTVDVKRPGYFGDTVTETMRKGPGGTFLPISPLPTAPEQTTRPGAPTGPGTGPGFELPASRVSEGFGAVGPISPEEKGQKYLDEKVPKQYQQMIKDIANYDIDPKSLSARTGERRNVLTEASNYAQARGEQFSQSEYPNRAAAKKYYGIGVGGTAVKSFNVAVDHMETMRELVKALDNKDPQIINSVKNKFKEQFGYDAPGNVEAARSVLGAEIAKAIIGGNSALADREELRAPFKSARTADQIISTMDKVYIPLVAGQLKGHQKQYEVSTGLKDFDTRLLSEHARKALLGKSNTVSGAPATEAAQGTVAPPTKRDAGQTYQTPKGPMTWTGTGWVPPQQTTPIEASHD